MPTLRKYFINLLLPIPFLYIIFISFSYGAQCRTNCNGAHCDRARAECKNEVDLYNKGIHNGTPWGYMGNNYNACMGMYNTTYNCQGIWPGCTACEH